MALAQSGDELVHDAAVHAYELVLRPLAEEGQFHPAQLEASEHLPGVGHGHLDSGRGAQARTDGNVADDYDIQARQFDASFFQEVGHPSLVVAPSSRLIVFDIIQGECDAFAEVQGVDGDLPVIARGRGNQNAPVNGHWQHVAIVVIGVLPDEVHPPRRSHDSSRFPTENLRKPLPDVRQANPSRIPHHSSFLVPHHHSLPTACLPPLLIPIPQGRNNVLGNLAAADSL